ncbi:MAG: hypothetical protein AAF721_02530 [Myxococcota bacterium]
MGALLTVALALAAGELPDKEPVPAAAPIRISVSSGDVASQVLIRGLEIAPWFEPVRCRFGKNSFCGFGDWCHDEANRVDYGVHVVRHGSRIHFMLHALDDDETLMFELSGPTADGRTLANRMLNTIVDELVP